MLLLDDDEGGLCADEEGTVVSAVASAGTGFRHDEDDEKVRRGAIDGSALALPLAMDDQVGVTRVDAIC